MSDIEKALQTVLDDATRQIRRITEWTERTSADKDSHGYGYKMGRQEQALDTAYYVQGVAHAYGIALDTTRLELAETGMDNQR